MNAPITVLHSVTVVHRVLCLGVAAAGGPPAMPDPTPQPPAGAGQILSEVAQVKWAALVALIVGFFMGLITWAGGRWVDHHRAGRVGLIMMLCAVAGGLLYAIVPQLIDSFVAGR